MWVNAAAVANDRFLSHTAARGIMQMPKKSCRERKQRYNRIHGEVSFVESAALCAKDGFAKKSPKEGI